MLAAEPAWQATDPMHDAHAISSGVSALTLPVCILQLHITSPSILHGNYSHVQHMTEQALPSYVACAALGFVHRLPLCICRALV